MKNEQVVTWFKHSGIATIVIDNPPVNALSQEVINQLLKALDEIENDANISVMILTGGGDKAFVAGGNIKEFPGWIAKGADFAKAKSLWLQHPLNKIEGLRIPTIVAINGLALGGGCELALCFDFRIAEKHVQIGLPEIKLGLFPGAGGTQRLPRLIGKAKAKAKEMIFTGRPLSAKEAEEIGLVNQVVGQGESMTSALQLAKELVALSKPALKWAKTSIDDGFDQPLAEGLEIEAENFGYVFQTKEVEESVRAFIEKRSPNFSV